MVQQAIKSFLSKFVQHMKEEEAMFGPLLLHVLDLI